MTTCSVPDCDKKHLALGYCSRHYAAFKKHGDPLVMASRWDGHVKVEKQCENETCENMVWKGKYCDKCRMRKHRHGDVNTVLPRRGNGGYRRSGHTIDRPRRFPLDTSVLDTWSPELAWLLGWAITDGCVDLSESLNNKRRNTLSWMLKDREPLEIFQRLFKTEKPIEECHKLHRESGERRLYYRLRLCGRDVAQKMVAHGVPQRKTFVTSMPPVPTELRYHFLRGVLEGDGYLGISGEMTGYKKLAVQITSGNERFVQEIRSMLGYGNIQSYFSDVGSWHNFCCDSSYAYELLTHLYQDSEGIRLARKYEIWESFLETGQTYRRKHCKNNNDLI